VSRFAASVGPQFGGGRQATATPHVRKAERLRVELLAQAGDALKVLPQPGEAVHCLMTGFYDLMHVVAALAAKEGPCRRLRLATLSYNLRNVAEMERMLTAGTASRIDLVCSTFFRNHNKDAFNRTRDVLAKGGGRRAAAATHAKVSLFDFGERGVMVFEGSANLRTNRSRENLMMTRDRGLHDWHAAWIDEAIGSYAEEEDEGRPGQGEG
jgi:hypothetical protein